MIVYIKLIKFLIKFKFICIKRFYLNLIERLDYFSEINDKYYFKISFSNKFE